MVQIVSIFLRTSGRMIMVNRLLHCFTLAQALPLNLPTHPQVEGRAPSGHDPSMLE